MERGEGAPLSPGGSLQRVFDAVCWNHASDSNHSEDLPLSAPKLTTAPSESPPLEELKRKYGGKACHQKQERTFSRCIVFGLGNTKWAEGPESTEWAEVGSEGNRELHFQVDCAVYKTVCGQIKEGH